MSLNVMLVVVQLYEMCKLVAPKMSQSANYREPERLVLGPRAPLQGWGCVRHPGHK